MLNFLYIKIVIIIIVLIIILILFSVRSKYLKTVASVVSGIIIFLFVMSKKKGVNLGDKKHNDRVDGAANIVQHISKTTRDGYLKGLRRTRKRK